MVSPTNIKGQYPVSGTGLYAFAALMQAACKQIQSDQQRNNIFLSPCMLAYLTSNRNSEEH